MEEGSKISEKWKWKSESKKLELKSENEKWEWKSESGKWELKVGVKSESEKWEWDLLNAISTVSLSSLAVISMWGLPPIQERAAMLTCMKMQMRINMGFQIEKFNR